MKENYSSRYGSVWSNHQGCGEKRTTEMNIKEYGDSIRKQSVGWVKQQDRRGTVEMSLDNNGVIYTSWKVCQRYIFARIRTPYEDGISKDAGRRVQNQLYIYIKE